MKRTYHGWLLVDGGDRDYKATISVEFVDAKDKRQRIEMERHGNEGCVDAIAYWEKRLKQPIALQPTVKGCYRVYTEK